MSFQKYHLIQKYKCIRSQEHSLSRVTLCDPGLSWQQLNQRRDECEEVLQGVLHRHPEEAVQDCEVHLRPLPGDQWEAREKG